MCPGPGLRAQGHDLREAGEAFLPSTSQVSAKAVSSLSGECLTEFAEPSAHRPTLTMQTQQRD